MRLVLILLFVVMAPSAMAGAWLQDHKKGFLSLGGVYDEQQKAEGTLYAEYGVRPKLTLGVKVDGTMTQNQLSSGTAFVFARKPIPVGRRSFKLAYELGVGSTFGTDTDTLVRAALSYGRGIKIGKRYGWIALDTIAEIPTSEGPDTYKLDGTIGLTLNDHFKVMMQVFVSQSDTTVSNTFAPSIIWQPGGNGPSYVAGIEDEDGLLALKLAIWTTF
ncbi:MAG: hypothetical protein AB3N09_12175 [Tateyamaria sp.]